MLSILDKQILKKLSLEPKLTTSALATSLSTSQPVIWRRIKRLQSIGVIKGKRLLLNQELLGFGVKVFLGIKLATKSVISLDDFERAASAIPEVQSIEHVLGLYDYRLRVVARDIADFERVLRRRIMTLPGAGRVEANVLLSEEVLPGPI
ncbi:Lrp/AsnC family transcriptional regulator [Paracoccaceae bacterium]|mgnify:FL=1|jgi:DNA-binding Lrp family transcriptional regulator|nr:Lrp/AsnC family transcriptional regulator [Paracoccaceae bacterium]MDG1676875.1 Lrp/AsnC family transcriptional regulator [Paracoccaceae bacterium]|tara:strand:- start:546 stop:995 length:450 start_codon:yes stop_codon:yes gene_type:complete